MKSTIYRDVFQMQFEEKFGGYMVDKNNDKRKNTYTKDMLVKKIADDVRMSNARVREVYEALEDNVAKALSCADSETDVSVRLFEGIVINSEFLPARKKVNNLTGETIIAAEKIKPKAHITRNYCDKITSYRK